MILPSDRLTFLVSVGCPLTGRTGTQGQVLRREAGLRGESDPGSISGSVLLIVDHPSRKAMCPSRI